MAAASTRLHAEGLVRSEGWSRDNLDRSGQDLCWSIDNYDAIGGPCETGLVLTANGGPC